VRDGSVIVTVGAVGVAGCALTIVVIMAEIQPTLLLAVTE
jgi:hypothetical protein